MEYFGSDIDEHYKDHKYIWVKIYFSCNSDYILRQPDSIFLDSAYEIKVPDNWELPNV